MRKVSVTVLAAAIASGVFWDLKVWVISEGPDPDYSRRFHTKADCEDVAKHGAIFFENWLTIKDLRSYGFGGIRHYCEPSTTL